MNYFHKHCGDSNHCFYERMKHGVYGTDWTKKIKTKIHFVTSTSFLLCHIFDLSFILLN